MKNTIIGSKTPYETLDPAVILDAVESVGFRCTGSLQALNSYENRVYQLGIEDADPLIAKFYRPGRWSDDSILEEHQFALELVQHEIPVVAPWVNPTNKTLHFYQDFRYSLFPRWGGRALELDSYEQLAWMGRFLGRMHAVSACRPFQYRQKIDVQVQGYSSVTYLLENNFIPPQYKTNYEQTVKTALQKVEQCFKVVGSVDYIRLHGDVHQGNILWSDAGPHIVDLDDCLMGPAVQDMWMLLSCGDDEHVKAQIHHLLYGYHEFYDFNHRELYLIEALRTLRMLYYSAWVARRWEDPTFPLNFPWFNTDHYWQEQIVNLREQSEALDMVITRIA